jgi:hypothetical protein
MHRTGRTLLLVIVFLVVAAFLFTALAVPPV